MCRGTLTRGATLPSPGVPAPRRIAVLTVSLAVALAPAAAHAQNGAGDEQYQDPFAGGSQQPAKPKPKPQATPVQPAPHQQVQPSQPSTQQTATSAQQPSAGSGGELPRTGFDVVPLALVGVVLVAAGLLLRRRAAHGRD
jgi:LPXTG-motif cell wall-anchored protein